MPDTGSATAPSLSDAIAGFIADREAYCSRQTADWYGRMLSPLANHFGNRELAQITEDDLRAYMLAQRKRAKPDGQVISSHTVNDEMRAAGVRQIFERLSKRTRIAVYPHLLRHTSATHAVLNGMDIGDLQIIMGHASVATTAVYIEAARAVRALAAHREHSPVNLLHVEPAAEPSAISPSPGGVQPAFPARAGLRRIK